MQSTPEKPAADTPQGFYRRSIRASVILGSVAGLFGVVYAGPRLGGLYLLFLGWMLANLVLWGRALREILGRRRLWRLIALVGAKALWMALLVGLAAWMDIGESLRTFLAFLLGLNTPFLVMFLKSIGRVLSQGRILGLGRDEREGEKYAPGDEITGK